jgi:hypothetical protein
MHESYTHVPASDDWPANCRGAVLHGSLLANQQSAMELRLVW